MGPLPAGRLVPAACGRMRPRRAHHLCELAGGKIPIMAKYGLFHGASDKPAQTFEGDKMAQNQEYVYIYRDEQTQSGNKKQVQVAAIKLGDGQCVKEIEGDEQRGGRRGY